MDKDQIISGVKKNAVSIAAGAVALGAVGVMFFYLDPQYEDVRQKTAGSAANVGTIDGLLGQQRPAIRFTAAGTRAEDEQLGVFPTEANINANRAVMDQVKLQSGQLLQQAVDVQVRRFAPLGFASVEAARAVWPLEGDRKSIQRDQFRRDYQRRINADNASDDGQFPAGSIQREVRGTLPPDQADLQARRDALEGRLRAVEPVNDQGQPADPESFAQRLAEEQSKLDSQLKYDRAQAGLMYLEPNTNTSGLSVHPLADAREAPSAADCFDAQVQLWVQETILRNLARANATAVQGRPVEEQNLLNAPVKHVAFLRVPEALSDQGPVLGSSSSSSEAPASPVDGGYGGGYGGYGGEFGGYGDPGGGGGPPQGASPTTPAGPGTVVRRGGGSGAAAPPAGTEGEAPAGGTETGLPVDAAATITPNYKYSVSGRPLHTGLYDLMQFNVTLRCEAQAVPYVLNQLQRDSFVTVLNVGLTNVDLAVAAAKGYVYGPRPVVELQLQCEMMFLRPWLSSLMPADVALTLKERTSDGSVTADESADPAAAPAGPSGDPYGGDPYGGGGYGGYGGEFGG